jgi:hypothetical protein
VHEVSLSVCSHLHPIRLVSFLLLPLLVTFLLLPLLPLRLPLCPCPLASLLLASMLLPLACSLLLLLPLLLVLLLLLLPIVSMLPFPSLLLPILLRPFLLLRLRLPFLFRLRSQRWMDPIHPVYLYPISDAPVCYVVVAVLCWAHTFAILPNQQLLQFRYIHLSKNRIYHVQLARIHLSVKICQQLPRNRGIFEGACIKLWVCERDWRCVFLGFYGSKLRWHVAFRLIPACFVGHRVRVVGLFCNRIMHCHPHATRVIQTLLLLAAMQVVSIH